LTSRRGKRSGRRRRRRRRKELARYTTMLESFREGDLLKMLVFFL
jgi:ribosomal protein L21E